MPNPYVNKVTVNNVTIIDLTEDTVTADTLMQGYTAHDKSGALITGTASATGGVTQDQDGYIVLPSTGGDTPAPSGGLEYETGTWTPSEDEAMPTISFSDTHTELPVFVMMADATGTDDATSTTNYGFALSNFESFTGRVPSSVSINARYALASYVYRSSTNPAQAVSAVTSLSGSTSSAMGYWVSTTGFIPSSGSTSRYWRSGRTYKWIAVWAPTN